MKVIGVYRKCDFVTLLGGASALTGIILSMHGYNYYAILCLILSSVCDGFDGVVARKIKSKDYQTVYGVELDTICDVISFGVLPMVIVQSLTSWNIYTSIVSVFFCLCGIIRLAYFNMLAITKKSDGKTFIGFPIIISAFIIPAVFFVFEIFKIDIGNIVYPIILFVCGVLFIVPVKLKKITTNQKVIYSLLGVLLVAILSYFYFTCR